MIITEKVLLKIHYSKVEFYQKLGYNCKPNDIVEMKINEVSYGSRIKIKVKCDICGKEKEIAYAKYNKNISNGGIYTCNTKCAQIKNRKTNLGKYGTEYGFGSELIKNKIKETNLEKYGVENQFQSEKFKTLMIENGRLIDELKTPFESYRKKVDNKTKIIKKELFKNWNGYDYYEKDYIKNNLNLNSNNRLYPTIDHKISVHYGFINNIPPEDISNINNLCITKRSINSSKKYLTEEEFLKIKLIKPF